MRNNKIRAALRTLGQRRPFGGPFLCGPCRADSHHWQVAEHRLPTNGFISISCQCLRCDCGAGRVLRLHLDAQPTGRQPDDSGSTKFARLLGLHSMLTPRARWLLARELLRTSQMRRRMRRETQWTVGVLLVLVVLVTVALFGRRAAILSTCDRRS
ncbi:hypothetical protein [Crossiella cryophila]|uniref:Uncharacterized protein n=1 Tax=Crossiella cryophila TaxID=43355 RepID=A0A7W7C9V4_9PSEU|nr:hypothetical protein [Crossiella cryophila]MBB4677217.1 hypothetical protein [Crossiella cryophila]